MSLEFHNDCEILVCGYYGKGNLGDDALLRIVLDVIPKSFKTWVLFGNNTNYEKIDKNIVLLKNSSLVKIFFRLKKVDFIILGGGNLLQDDSSIRNIIYYSILISLSLFYKKKVILLAQGIGPLRSAISKIIVNYLVRNVQAISTRDIKTYELVSKLRKCKNTLYAPDIVWLYPSYEWLGGNDIFICLKNLKSLTSTKLVMLLTSLNNLAQSADCQIIWMSFHREQDRFFFDSLLKNNLIPKYILSKCCHVNAYNVSQAIYLFRRAKLVISMRLHPLIIANLAGCPSFAITDEQKVIQACLEAGIGFQTLYNMNSQVTLTNSLSRSFGLNPNKEKIAHIRKRAYQHINFLDMNLK